MVKFERIEYEWFEVTNSRTKLEPIYPSHYDYSDIDATYDCPSSEKVDIWHYWLDWLLTDTADKKYIFGRPFICSKNRYSFSLAGNVYDKEDNFIGTYYITKDHNRIYLSR